MFSVNAMKALFEVTIHEEDVLDLADFVQRFGDVRCISYLHVSGQWKTDELSLYEPDLPFLKYLSRFFDEYPELYEDIFGRASHIEDEPALEYLRSLEQYWD